MDFSTTGNTSGGGIIVVSQLPIGASPFTVSGWFKHADLSTEANLIQWGVATSSHCVLLGINNAVMNLRNQSSGAPPFIGIKNVYGQWRMFALTYDGTTASIYVDGILDVSGPYTFDTSATGVWSIGYGFVTADHWDGALADIRAYNRCLSASEIKYLHGPHSYSFSTNGLLAWYKMDEFKNGNNIAPDEIMDSSSFRIVRSDLNNIAGGPLTKITPPLRYP